MTLVWADSPVRVTKTKPRNNGKVLIKAKCVYRISERYTVGEGKFTITMDTAIGNFKSKQVEVVSSTADTFFSVQNIKNMRPDRFVAIFSGLYDGDGTTPIPTGNCSDLILPTTTPVPPATTTTPAVIFYEVPGVVQSDAVATKCHTVEVTCSFAVTETIAPGDVKFNLTFTRNVGRFKDNYGEVISQASEPGPWIFTQNKFQLDPPSFVYLFQISYHSDPEPEVVCISTLPPL